jgi:hypothetical protein
MIPAALELLVRLAGYVLRFDPLSLRVIVKVARFIWRVLG